MGKFYLCSLDTAHLLLTFCNFRKKIQMQEFLDTKRTPLLNFCVCHPGSGVTDSELLRILVVVLLAFLYVIVSQQTQM